MKTDSRVEVVYDARAAVDGDRCWHCGQAIDPFLREEAFYRTAEPRPIYHRSCWFRVVVPSLEAQDCRLVHEQ